MYRKLNNIALCLALVFGLVGCATQRHSSPLAAQAQANMFNLSGRLALVVEQADGKKQATTLAFTLKGNAQNGTLQLRSPLGNILGIATWTPTQAQLQQGTKTQSYASLDELLHALTGTSIPAHALFDWLRGDPIFTSGWHVDLSQHHAGKIYARREHPKPVVHLRMVVH